MVPNPSQKSSLITCRLWFQISAVSRPRYWFSKLQLHNNHNSTIAIIAILVPNLRLQLLLDPINNLVLSPDIANKDGPDWFSIWELHNSHYSSKSQGTFISIIGPYTNLNLFNISATKCYPLFGSELTKNDDHVDLSAQNNKVQEWSSLVLHLRLALPNSAKSQQTEDPE